MYIYIYIYACWSVEAGYCFYLPAFLACCPDRTMYCHAGAAITSFPVSRWRADEVRTVNVPLRQWQGILTIGFEATCARGEKKWDYEIIEFPALFLDWSFATFEC